MKTAEQTSCVRPLKRRRICAASVKSAGLPMTSSSRAMSVSAAITILSGYARATRIPFRIAFHMVSSRNVRSRSNFSATRGATVSNPKPASESNAARLGEQDASTSEALTRTTVRGLRYGLGESDGAEFFLSKMSGSFVSLKSPGTVNSLSLIGSRFTEVIVVVISGPWSEEPGLDLSA